MTLSLVVCGPHFLFCTRVTSQPVSCSGAAFWSAQEPTCVLGGRVLQPPLCHSPALSNFLPVGLFVLKVVTVVLTSGYCQVKGLQVLAVWLAHRAQ